MNEAETKIVKQFVAKMEKAENAAVTRIGRHGPGVYWDGRVASFEVINAFPEYEALKALKEDKLNPEEERRLAESSAFPSGFMEKMHCGNPENELTVITRGWYDNLKKEALKYYNLERELKKMTLWDRIFNWHYKE